LNGCVVVVVGLGLAVAALLSGQHLMLLGTAAFLALGAWVSISALRGRGADRRRVAVRRSGTPALAQITSLRRIDEGTTNRRTLYEMEVVVHADGEAPRAARVQCWATSGHMVSLEDEGIGEQGWLPVRVDRADPSLVVPDAGT
jgi:hypothetical protein